MKTAFLIALSLTCASLTACSTTKDVPSRANGQASELWFQGHRTFYAATEGYIAQGIAVGATYTYDVARYNAGTVACRSGDNSTDGPRYSQDGSLALAGVTLFYPCDALAPTAAVVVRAACDEEFCSVKAAVRDDHHVTLELKASKPGISVLRVRLRETATGVEHEDSIAVTFANPTAIALSMKGSFSPFRGPVVAGHAWLLPHATLLSESGLALDADDGALRASVAGPAVVLDGPRVRAKSGGTTKVVWTWLERAELGSLPIEVVEPSHVKKFVISQLPHGIDMTRDVAFGGTSPDPLAGLFAPQESVILGAPDAADYLVIRAELDDGRVALLPLIDNQVHLQGLRADTSYESDNGVFSVRNVGADNNKGSAATITVDAMGMQQSWPVTPAP